MTANALPNSSESLASENLEKQPETRDVVTRFGKVTVHKSRAIHFAKGFVGMPERQLFCLTDFPMEKLRQSFKLMQCLTDDELAFMMLPIPIQNDFVAEEDVREACTTLEIGPENLVMLLVVTVHRRVNAVSLSVNTRAPVFVDSLKRIATQYVLPHNRYEIRQMVGASGQKLQGTYDD